MMPDVFRVVLEFLGVVLEVLAVFVEILGVVLDLPQNLWDHPQDLQHHPRSSYYFSCWGSHQELTRSLLGAYLEPTGGLPGAYQGAH